MNTRNIKNAVLGGLAGIALIVSMNKIYDYIVTPEDIPAEISLKDQDTMQRFSYIPEGSLFRPARSWYDRVIEEYSRNERNTFELSKKTTVTYHYPILGELGGMYTTSETEIVKKN